MFFKKFIIYKNIDELPIDVFKKVLKTYDVSHLGYWKNILGNKIERKVKKKYYPELQKAWISCYNQYLQTFGHNRNHLLILELEDKIAINKIKMWTTDNKSISAFIKRDERLLKELMLPNKEKGSFEEDLIVIQKHQGVPIDGKLTSVRRFFTYVKMMQKEADQIKRDNAKKNRK